MVNNSINYRQASWSWTWKLVPLRHNMGLHVVCTTDWSIIFFFQFAHTPDKYDIIVYIGQPHLSALQTIMMQFSNIIFTPLKFQLIINIFHSSWLYISDLKCHHFIRFSIRTLNKNPTFGSVIVLKLLFICQEAKEVKVLDCRIFNSFQGTGIAVLTSTYRMFIINSVDEPRIQRLAEVPGEIDS